MSASHDTDSDIGGPFDFIGDAVEAIGDVAEDIVDGIGDVVKAIPGGEWILDGVGTVTGAVGDFVAGPMRDFAKTAVGETIFRAASVAMSQALYVVPGVGLTLGFLAFSVPGLAKGERFDEALTKEFIYRVEQVAEFFAGQLGEAAAKQITEVMGDQLKIGVEKLSQLAQDSGVNIEDVADTLGITPDSLANMLGIRPDVAAYAIAWAGRKGEAELAELQGWYDPETGKRTKLFAPAEGPVRRIGAKPASPPITKNYVMAQAVSAPKAKVSIASYVPVTKPIALATAKNNVNIAAVANTLAAKGAVAASTPKVVETAKKVDENKSTKYGIAAGLMGAAVGTGVSLAAGLSAAITAPVAIGFGVGSGVVTKLLTRHNK